MTAFMVCSMTEVWKTIPDFPDYEVSSEGRVRKLPMKGTRTSHGYMRVSLMKDGKTYYRYVHQVVCSAFHGERPGGAQVAHGNGDKVDNRAQNLRWATPTENNADKVIHGTQPRAQRSHLAKLSDASIADIRERKASGTRSIDLSREYGVHVETIRCIARGAKRRYG